MEESTVTTIVNDMAKQGTSQRTGKPWSMSQVKLQNNEVVYTFNPVAIGDVLVCVEKDGYRNWAKKRVDPQHEEIMKALKSTYAKLLDLERKLKKTGGGHDDY